MTHDLALGKSIVAKGEAARDMEGIELENIKCVTCLLARQMDLYFNFATVFGENQAAKGVAELTTMRDEYGFSVALGLDTAHEQMYRLGTRTRLMEGQKMN